jgi:hypothetical protein
LGNQTFAVKATMVFEFTDERDFLVDEECACVLEESLLKNADLAYMTVEKHLNKLYFSHTR